MASSTVNTISVMVKSPVNSGAVSAYPTANGENSATPLAHTLVPSSPSADPATSVQAPPSWCSNRNARPRAAARTASTTGRHSRSPADGTAPSVTATSTTVRAPADP